MVTCVFCIQTRAGKEHSRSLKFHTFDVRIEPFDFNGLICLVLFIIYYGGTFDRDRPSCTDLMFDVGLKLSFTCCSVITMWAWELFNLMD